MLQVRRLEKTIDNRTALSIEELDINAGDIVTVVGQIGSGKTLLIRLLCGMLVPSGGKALLDGKDVHTCSEARNRIGVMFEEDLLYGRTSAQGNLDLYCRLHNLPASRVAEVLALLGMSDQASKQVSKLSPVAQRRLAFARALIGRPSILLLDQPELRIDLDTQSLFLRLIKEIAGEGTAVLMTAEDLAWSGSCSTQIVELADGHVVSKRVREPAQAEPATPERLLPFKIPARKEDRIMLFDPGELLYATSREGKTYLRTANEEATTNLTLQELETRLAGRGFFKAHRAYLVNLQHIKAVIQYTRNSYTLQLNDKQETMIPLSKQSEKELQELLVLKILVCAIIGREMHQLLAMEGRVPESPDLEWKTTSDLRALGDALLRISRMLHDHTRRLEVAVEGTYAGDSGDPRVRLLSDSLRISRTADLELGRLNQAGQRILTTLQEQLAQVRETQEYLRQSSSQLPPIAHPSTTGSIQSPSDALNSSINNLKRDELETLYEIARTLNSTLVFDEVLRKVMDQVIRVVDAERGFLVLVNPDTKELTFPIARDKQERTIDPRAFNFSRGTVERVVRTKQPVLTDDAQVEMKEQESIVAYGIRSIICAPLVVRGDSIGAVYVDSRINANLFGPRHRDLLFAFCHQAAIAIHNARLFDDLTKAIRQVEEDKQYMDNIFASIANGVITTDPAGIITKFNAAAGLILRINPLSAIGRHYQQVFQAIPHVGLTRLLQNVPTEHNHGTIVPETVDCEIDGRTGVVNLTLYASSLRDARNTPIGMALVIDDRTEVKRMEADKKRAEASAKEIRRIFGRFVHPNVVEQLINNPAALNLGGESKEISVIKADIRSFTRLSERIPSKEVMNLLNTYMEIMVNAIWDEGGTVTGFWGDELMAIFNAPLRQDDHALRAVRAAWKMRLAVLEYQRKQPQEMPLAFGFGVNTGEAMVGNIGSKERIQNYTAIGDTINVAARLQGAATDNDIFLHHATFTRVRQSVRVTKLAPLSVKNKTEPLNVWCLVGWY